MYICYCKMFIDLLQQNVIYCAYSHIEHAHVWYTSGAQEIQNRGVTLPVCAVIKLE